MLPWEEDAAGRHCTDAIACQEPHIQREMFTKGVRRSFLGIWGLMMCQTGRVIRELCAD